jgi:hypothetical protein
MTPPTPAASLESPSLVPSEDGAGPAFELKFLLDAARAREVEAWARLHLAPDPHGEAALGGAYWTTSLYFDTPELDVYHRSPGYGRRKFRVRRYGAAAWAFLERKSKWGDRVEKRRAAVPLEELALLAHPLSVVSWAGHWFHRRLLARGLVPACRVSYLRSAYVGTGAAGPLRLTLDRQARGTLSREWGLGPVEAALPLLRGRVILELKFHLALPGPFKALVEMMRLSPSGVPKYRLCREAWGLPWRRRGVADA